MSCIRIFLNNKTETAATSGKSTACDVMFVNLQYTSHVSVVKEAATNQLPPLPSLNLEKVSTLTI